MRDLAFLAAWVVLLPVALQGAQLGVLLWTWTSLLAPNDVLYGFAATMPFAKVAAILTIVLLVIGRGGGIRLRFDVTVLIMLALAVGGAISQATGLAADPADGWDLYQKFAKILLLAIVVTAVMRDRLRLHALLLTICLGIGFTGLGEGAKFLLSGGAHKVLGTPSTGDNNQVGLDVLLIMPMLYYLHATAKVRALRLTCVAVALMCAVCIVATNSRAAFVGLVILAVVFVLSSRRKLIGLLIVAALAGAGTQLVSTTWIERMNSIEAADDDSSFLGRVGAWKESIAVALERPLFGGGFHAIQHGDVWAAHYAQARLIPLISPEPPSVTPKAAHSIYFEVLGDLGFIGLALFLALFATALRNARKVRGLVRRSGRRDLDWAASMAGALQVSTIVFLIGGASLSAAYYDIDYLMVAMLAVLKGIVERAVREPEPTATTARADAAQRQRAREPSMVA